MYAYHKTLLIGMLLNFFAYAEEFFINHDGLKLAHITLSNSYCKSIKPSQQFCESEQLSYIDYDDAQLPAFLKGIKAHIAPVVAKYRAGDLRKITLENIKDMDGDIVGEWNNESTIDLFAKTPTTYTLSTSSSGYEGGAHGYHYQEYDNYDTKTNAKLTLGELFMGDYNQTLHRIAEVHYKEYVGLTPNQPLTDEGWFDDKFVLAKSFAITPNGLYFFYNSYEIKAYAAGNTVFMLPYSKIRSIINPIGALSFALRNRSAFHTSFAQESEMSIDIDAQTQKNGTVKITAKMQNLSYLNKGWFSLSFPQFEDKNAIKVVDKKGFKNVQAYSKGSKVYHNEYKKAVPSSYLLVEGEDNDWKNNDMHTIILTLTPPTNQKELIVDIRGNFKSKDKTIMLPSEYEGVKGQQGFTNYRLFIEL